MGRPRSKPPVGYLHSAPAFDLLPLPSCRELKGEFTMSGRKRDKTKVDPLSAAEEPEPAEPLKTVPKGREANASTAVIPGTGHFMKNKAGQEVKRVVRT
jgi:hypothetical protein